MNPNRNQLLVLTIIVVWGIAYVVWTSQWLYGDNHFLVERALRRILTCSFGAACCWGIKLILDRVSAWSLLGRIGIAVLLCAACSAAYAVVNTIVFYRVIPRWGSMSMGDALDLIELVGFLFFAWTGLYFAINADAEARDTRLRLAGAQNEALRARNQALAQQINPHFLFNALNTVSGLIIDGQTSRAESVTVSLAALLRRSLEADMDELMTLGEEMEAAHRYLDIEQNRFEDRFAVVENVPAAVRFFPVPPMILQPLIENAVKHGVARSADPVCLAIEATVSRDILTISIIDNARPLPGTTKPSGSGIGIANVRQRLALLYGDRARIACDRPDKGGFRCVLTIPADRNAFA